MPSFREMLTTRQQEVNSILWVGLDPDPKKVPDIVRASCPSLTTAVLLWMQEVVATTAHAACMIKPQLAHWETLPDGLRALQTLIAWLHYKFPGLLVFGDSKRGDIDRTQEQYRNAILALHGADGMNYNGYMGRSTLKSLIDSERPGRGLVGLGRTSNPDAWEIQDQKLADGRCIWEFMVERQLAWSEELGVIADAGIVMGAAHQDPVNPDRISSWHLSRAREITGNKMWQLIPALGTQKGFVVETIRASYNGPGTMTAGAASSITNASQGTDFAEAAARKAEELRDQMRGIIAELPVPAPTP